MTTFGANQMRVFGILMVLTYAFVFVKKPIAIQREPILYIIWAFWCILGLAKAVEPELFWQDYWVVFQMCPMILVIAGICGERGTMTTTFLALALGGLIMFGSSLLTGEITRTFSENEDIRVTGITKNANHYGYNLLMAIMALMYFWRKKVSAFYRTLSFTAATTMVMGILASGSRKSFVGFVLLSIFWFYFCYRKQARNLLLIAVVFIVGLAGLAGVTHFMMKNTVMGERFAELRGQDSEYLREEYSRTILYKEGLRLIAQNPVIGIGLGNFKAVSSLGVYTHSDYLEIAVSSGLPGLLLYLSIYASLLFRIRKLRQRIKDELAVYTLGLIKAGIFTILLLSFGRPNYIAMQTWVFLASAIGYTWHLEREAVPKEDTGWQLRPDFK